MKSRCNFLLLCMIIISLVLYGCAGVEEGNLGAQNTTVGSIFYNTDALLSLPPAYEDTVLDYKKVIDFRLSDTFESDYNGGQSVPLNENLTEDLSTESQNAADFNGDIDYKWTNMLVEMTDGLDDPSRKSFGYILKDINGDDTPELFWVREDYTILAVFTIKDNNAKLLDAYWSRYKCVLTDSGELYTLGSNGVANNNYQVKQLAKNSVDMYLIQEFGTDGIEYVHGVPTGTIYYEVKEQQRIIVTEERYEELLSLYPFQNGNNWGQLIINNL